MLHVGHVLDVLRGMDSESVDCVVTSPPYYGLRDYGLEPVVWGGDPQCNHRWGNFCECGAWRGCLGLEPDYNLFVSHMVDIFGEVRRVLKDKGTLWLNLGDSYATGSGSIGSGQHGGKHAEMFGDRIRHQEPNRMPQPNLKPKDLMGMPWRVAFALQDSGWWLRSDIVWHKPNPMPESVSDRPTKAHEYIFLMAKSQRFYYDAEAIKEPVTGTAHDRGNGVNQKASGWDTGEGNHKGLVGRYKQNESFSAAVTRIVENRNKRSVWTVPSEAYPEAHFATFPTKLIKPCILAGCPEGGTVLDPFMGSGTTALVARNEGRQWVGIEANPEYAEMLRGRLAQGRLF